MWPAFFIRVRPASRKAKPACMNMTRTAVMTTQMVLAAISKSWFLSTGLHLLQALAGSVVHDVRHFACPHEPVSRLVAAARRVDDRLDDGLPGSVRAGLVKFAARSLRELSRPIHERPGPGPGGPRAR